MDGTNGADGFRCHSRSRCLVVPVKQSVACWFDQEWLCGQCSFCFSEQLAFTMLTPLPPHHSLLDLDMIKADSFLQWNQSELKMHIR